MKMSNAQQTRAEEILEAFELLEDWESRYDYLIDLGRGLPLMPEEEHTDENLVRGCQSQVWVSARAERNSDVTVIRLNADSNSAITKGIVAILYQVYSGEKPNDILQFDIDGFMIKLGLDQHLSPARRNGLAGMVTRIKTLAAIHSGE